MGTKGHSLEYEFATNTTCHGLKHIADSKSVCARMIWVLLVLGAFGFLAFQMISITFEFVTYNAVSEVMISVRDTKDHTIYEHVYI